MNDFHPISFGNYYYRKVSRGGLSLPDKGFLFQVTTINLFHVDAVQAGFHPSEVKEHVGIAKAELCPVEISEQLLVGLGFRKLNQNEFILRIPERVMGSTFLLVQFDTDLIWLSYTKDPSKSKGEALRSVDYIHQIQNTWLALTDNNLFLSDEYLSEYFPMQAFRAKIKHITNEEDGRINPLTGVKRR